MSITLFPKQLALLAVFGAALLTGGAVEGQCTRFSRNYPGEPWRGGSIGLIPRRGLGEAELRAAVAVWQRCCADAFAGSAIPELWVNQPGDRTVYIDYIDSTSPRPGACGSFNGATITLWNFTLHGDKRVLCAPRVRLIAHEIGHILGLADAPRQAECASDIMAPVRVEGAWSAAVAPRECELAARANFPTDLQRDEVAELAPLDEKRRQN